jgi:hypothetical protein
MVDEEARLLRGRSYVRTWSATPGLPYDAESGSSTGGPMSLLPPDAAVKKDRWAEFRGLRPWQVVLAVLPAPLIVGGLLGGGIAAAGLMANLWVARRALKPVVKVPVMLGVVAVTYATYLVALGLIRTYVRP